MFPAFSQNLQEAFETTTQKNEELPRRINQTSRRLLNPGKTTCISNGHLPYLGSVYYLVHV